MIEIIVVLIFLSILSVSAVEGYEYSVKRSKEMYLRQELLSMRAAIDRFYMDRLRESPGLKHLERFPSSLKQLVEMKYLRRVPVDPLTGEASWDVVPASESGGNLFDVKSRARGVATDKTLYSEW